MNGMVQSVLITGGTGSFAKTILPDLLDKCVNEVRNNDQGAG